MILNTRDNNKKVYVSEGQCKLLAEYGGVSDEVLDISNWMRKKIVLYLNRDQSQCTYDGEYDRINDWKSMCLINDWKLTCLKKSHKISKMSLSDINDKLRHIMVFKPDNVEYIKNIYVFAYGYNPSKITEYDFLVALFNKNSENGIHTTYFDSSNQCIYMSVPCAINSKTGEVSISDDYLRTINHEVKHALQNSKRGDITDTYYGKSISFEQNDHTRIDWLGMTRYHIKYSYYILAYNEVDALLQEVYIDLINGGDGYSSIPYRHLKSAENIFNIIKSYVVVDGYRNNIYGLLKNIFGSDFKPGKYFEHCQNGVNRFHEHVMRIFGRAHNERGMKEGRIIREGNEDVSRYNHCGFEMLVGIPGCGKSTYLRKVVSPNVLIVCPDDIRRELTGNISDQSKNGEVWSLSDKRIGEGLKSGRYVILDATNVGTRNRVNMLSKIKASNPGISCYATIFDCNPEVSKQRIANDIKNGVDRSNVPADVIDRMYKSYLETLDVIRGEGFDDVFFV